MASFCLDGSALAKRYVPEPGSALVDFILDSVPEDRIYLLNIGAAEVVSVLVRKRNAGTLSVANYSQAILELEIEVIQSPAKHLLSFDNSVVIDAVAYIMMHSINATDAIILGVALDVAQHLRNQGGRLGPCRFRPAPAPRRPGGRAGHVQSGNAGPSYAGDVGRPVAGSGLLLRFLRRRLERRAFVPPTGRFVLPVQDHVQLHEPVEGE